MLSKSELEQLRRLNMKDVRISELKELKKTRFSASLTVEERLELFLHQIKNPYHFTVGGTPVYISFLENSKTLDEALCSYLTDIKNLDNY